MASNQQELLEAWQKWYNDPLNQENADILYKTARPLITRIVGAYLGQRSVHDPLIMGRAKQILFNSLRQYDQSKGPITAYLWTNMQRIQRISNVQQNVIRLSEQDALAARELENTVQKLTEELGREPTDEEIADNMGISIKRIAKLRRRKLGFESSFEAGDEEGSGSLPGSVSLGRSPSEIGLAKTLYDASSDTQEKFIIERLYGLHGHPPKSVSEIAQKLNISKSAVSQRVKKINDKILALRSAFSST